VPVLLDEVAAPLAEVDGPFDSPLPPRDTAGDVAAPPVAEPDDDEPPPASAEVDGCAWPQAATTSIARNTAARGTAPTTPRSDPPGSRAQCSEDPGRVGCSFFTLCRFMWCPRNAGTTG
jgi:hypothetical protein